MKSTDIIPADLIDLAEQKGACRNALEWLRAAPRTWQKLTDYCCPWLEWAVRNLDITSLPDGLTVGGDLYLYHCHALATIPEGLTVGGHLSLSHCPATIPADISVRGKIYRQQESNQ